jgi:hypothetical protein
MNNKPIFYFSIIDFYTEDAVNNQGLECLRFLNEVISDYDAVSLKQYLITELVKHIFVFM